MTERKPPGMSWETWIDRQIREGMERGEFDGLPGHGQPIRDLDQPRDDLWWVRDKLRREDAQLLPPTLALRKEVEDARERIAAATAESEVRAIVADINERIVKVNSRATAGPPSTVVKLDEEHVVRQWREARQGQD